MTRSVFYLIIVLSTFNVFAQPGTLDPIITEPGNSMGPTSSACKCDCSYNKIGTGNVTLCTNTSGPCDAAYFHRPVPIQAGTTNIEDCGSLNGGSCAGYEKLGNNGSTMVQVGKLHSCIFIQSAPDTPADPNQVIPSNSTDVY